MIQRSEPELYITIGIKGDKVCDINWQQLNMKYPKLTAEELYNAVRRYLDEAIKFLPDAEVLRPERALAIFNQHLEELKSTSQPPTYTQVELEKLLKRYVELLQELSTVFWNLDGLEGYSKKIAITLAEYLALPNNTYSVPLPDVETEPKECVWKCIDVTNDEYETGCGRNEDYPNPNMKYCGFCGLPIKVEGE